MSVQVTNNDSARKNRPTVSISLFLLCLHLVVSIGVVWQTMNYPILMSLAVLAYGLGLRHALDPDHIAAIDSTVRKLIQEKKKPQAVGLYFSLGHSTVVILLAAIIALSSSFLVVYFPTLKATGELIGASVSCFFLLLIGLINLVIFFDLIRMRHKRKEHTHEQTADKHNLEHASGGLLTKVFKPVLNLVKEDHHIYFVGLLFGLGFDTATEVSLLSITGSTGMQAIPFGVILLIPLAFTAGMTLLDSIDGLFMSSAYHWAQFKPLHRLYYNLIITFISAAVAIVIGLMEGAQILSEKFALHSPLIHRLATINMENWGFYLIGLFAIGWIMALAILTRRRLIN